MINTKDFEVFLKNRFGLPISVQYKHIAEGSLITIQPLEIPHTIGFSIELLLGWRSIEARFVPGRYAAELVKIMGAASNDQRSVFKVFFESIVLNGGIVRLIINNVEFNPNETKEWPVEWLRVNIKMRKEGLVLNLDDSHITDIIYPWCARFMGMTLALLPIESAGEPLTESHEEGMPYETIAKKYERSQINRAACIEFHGLNCKVCGFSFLEYYGEIGSNFIHVHHLEPLSIMEGSYCVNPANDMIPVCPNCHVMMHRRNPPFSIEEMKAILGSD